MMDCEEITKITTAQQALKSNDKRLIEQLYSCMYCCFKNKFINGIKMRDPLPNMVIPKNEVEELAEEAFQAGVTKFYEHTLSKELEQKANASLYTVIKTFGEYQYMAIKKRRWIELNRTEQLDVGEGNQSDDEDAPDIKRHHISSTAENAGNWKNLSDDELVEAISMLPKLKWRQVIVLHYFDNMGFTEIAERLQVSKGDVYNTLSHAKKELKEIIRKRFK